MTIHITGTMSTIKNEYKGGLLCSGYSFRLPSVLAICRRLVLGSFRYMLKAFEDHLPKAMICSSE